MTTIHIMYGIVNIAGKKGINAIYTLSTKKENAEIVNTEKHFNFSVHMNFVLMANSSKRNGTIDGTIKPRIEVNITISALF